MACPNGGQYGPLILGFVAVVLIGHALFGGKKDDTKLPLRPGLPPRPADVPLPPVVVEVLLPSPMSGEVYRGWARAAEQNRAAPATIAKVSTAPTVQRRKITDLPATVQAIAPPAVPKHYRREVVIRRT